MGLDVTLGGNRDNGYSDLGVSSRSFLWSRLATESKLDQQQFSSL